MSWTLDACMAELIRVTEDAWLNPRVPVRLGDDGWYVAWQPPGSMFYVYGPIQDILVAAAVAQECEDAQRAMVTLATLRTWEDDEDE